MAKFRLTNAIHLEFERGRRLTGRIGTKKIKTESRSRAARWLDYYGTRVAVMFAGYIILVNLMRPVLALTAAILLTLLIDFLLKRRQKIRLTQKAKDMDRKKIGKQMLDAVISGSGADSESHIQALAKQLGFEACTSISRPEQDTAAFIGENPNQRGLVIVKRSPRLATSSDVAAGLALAEAEQVPLSHYINTFGYTEPAVRLAKQKNLRLIELSQLADAKPAAGQGDKAQGSPQFGETTSPAQPDASETETPLDEILQKLISKSWAGVKSLLLLAAISLLLGGTMRYYFLVFACINAILAAYYYLKARRYLMAVADNPGLF